MGIERNTYGLGPEPTNCIIMFVPLIDCDFCGIGYEPEDIFEIDGQKLCRDCKQTYHQQVELKRIEDQIQNALNELPTDQLLTLELALSIAQQSISGDTPQNIQLWMLRLNEALHIKVPNVLKIGKFSAKPQMRR